MFPTQPHARAVPALAPGLMLLLAALGAGCGGQGKDTRAAAPADTVREGSVFITTFENGPVDQIRIVRDTADRIVVHGATGFSDGTRVSIALLRPRPDGSDETAAVTVATVALGRFQGQPLAGASGPAPPGLVRVRLTVQFARGKQDESVRAASGDGRRFTGRGMHVAPDGSAYYDLILEAPL